MARAAVIFDLDDTLIVEESFAMASLEEAVAQLPGVDPATARDVALEAVRSVWKAGVHYGRCVDLGIASWEGLWSSFTGNHDSLDGLGAWAPEYRVAAWEAVAARFGVDHPDPPRAAADTFVAAQRRGHPPIVGMRDALATVSERYPVALLTNGPSDIQRLKLDQAGLAGSFAAVCISGERGVGKPDRRAFTAVLDAVGADATHSVMVGDSWERDILGARSAGMRAVWIADGRHPPDRLPDVSVVDSVRDLADVLDG